MIEGWLVCAEPFPFKGMKFVAEESRPGWSQNKNREVISFVPFVVEIHIATRCNKIILYELLDLAVERAPAYWFAFIEYVLFDRHTIPKLHQDFCHYLIHKRLLLSQNAYQYYSFQPYSKPVG
jgi:hypothetical protein